jgi:fucose permease
MPFFGGVFIDRLGMSLGIVIFSSLLLIGQIIQWQATVHSDYAFFIVGRIIFGLGGENMCITMNAFIAKWFLGTELSFALGISVASANLGSVLTALTQPRLA